MQTPENRKLETDVVPVASRFFDEVLPGVADLQELKLILKVIQLGSLRPDRLVSLEDLTNPKVVRLVCGQGSPEPGEVRIGRVMDRAVRDGFLLRFSQRNAGRRDFILLKTPQSERLVADLASGRAGPSSAGAEEAEAHDDVTLFRSNVYAQYEQKIGVLTPLVAEQLREAERSYPRRWLDEAISRAAAHGRRSWPYVEAILIDWEQNGAPL